MYMRIRFYKCMRILTVTLSEKTTGIVKQLREFQITFDITYMIYLYK